ncbi:MAG: Recombination protein RecR [bacterium ADurb.Bin212]|nr:MAG: Recombination protein RecR [bacterium ADurb.Bin212]
MLPKSVQNLIDEFAKLPGIGNKSAARLVFYLLTKPDYDVERFGNSLLNLKSELKLCPKCYNLTDLDVCRICNDDRRNRSLVAVVEEPLDVIALEKSGGFNGIYHVLGGSIDPLNGIGPEDLRINELIAGIAQSDSQIKEIIIATNPNFEGEATASYIKEKIALSDNEIKITRIARGLPMGGDLEYADEVTLKRSLEGRREIE